MPIRVISDPHGSDPLDRDLNPADQSPSHRRTWIAAAIAVALALIVGMGIFLTTQRQPVPKPQQVTTPSSWPSAEQDGADAPTNPVEGVPGLARGTAAVTSGNSGGALHGIPVGWPQSLDGAVSAAMVYHGAVYQPVTYIDKYRKTVQQRLYTSEGLKVSAMNDTLVKQMRQHYRINPQGQVVLGGRVSPKETFFADPYPRYGAYKILSYEGSEQQPTLAVVDVWMPYVMGPGTPKKLDEVFVGWIRAKVEVKWENGDWRINGTRSSRTFPTPPDPRRTNQPFAVRRELLGTGWSVLADASESPLPGAVLTR